MAGRPPKPPVLHRLEATFDPSRHTDLAEPDAPGELSGKLPPAWMTDAQKELWVEVLLDAPRNLMRRIDWPVFANYIEVMDRHAQAVQAQRKVDEGQALPFLAKGRAGPVISPYIKIINHCVMLMVKLQSEMGFTPLARTRMAYADRNNPAGDPAGDAWGMLRRFPVIDGEAS